MTEHGASPIPAPDPSATGGPPDGAVDPARQGLAPLQVTLDDAPDRWIEAARHAPAPEPAGNWPRGQTRIAVVPVRREGAFVAGTVAAATGFVAGAAWYLADLVGLDAGPWAPLAVALAIGLAVRVSSQAHPSDRSLVSIVTYLIVLLTVLVLSTHRDLVAIYGQVEDYRTYEQSLVRGRLQDPVRLAAYTVGGLVAAILPIGRDRR